MAERNVPRGIRGAIPYPPMTEQKFLGFTTVFPNSVELVFNGNPRTHTSNLVTIEFDSETGERTISFGFVADPEIYVKGAGWSV